MKQFLIERQVQGITFYFTGKFRDDLMPRFSALKSDAKVYDSQEAGQAAARHFSLTNVKITDHSFSMVPQFFN